MDGKIMLSVIVPIYNVAPYLKDCLESLLDQGFTEDEYEVICVDDGSTDASLEIIERYAKDHKCIKCIHQDNAGVSVARNTGLDHATGKYIAFVDGDDYLVAGALKILCHEADTRDADTLTYDYITVEEDSSYQRVKVEIGALENNTTGIVKSTATVWRSLVKREIIKNNRLYFPAGAEYGEDFFFSGMVSMFVKADKQVFVKADVYCYRQRNSSAMHTSGNEKLKKHMNGMLLTINNWNAFLKKHPELSEEKKCNIKDRIYLCSAAALLDALRNTDINEYEIREELKEKNAYPYPYIPYMIKQKFNLSNLIMIVLRYDFVFEILARTKVLKGK